MMNKKNNIVLIGMPGVGKSTVGVILAKVLGYEFLDADILIQKQEGKLLREIIEEVGTDGFIEVENRVNAGIECTDSIIATGGSVVYGKEAMEHLKEIGTVVYLEVPFSILEKRLSDIKGRGVVLKDGQTLHDLYMERTPLYEHYADIRVSEDGLDVEQTVELLIKELQTLNNKQENIEQYIRDNIFLTKVWGNAYNNVFVIIVRTQFVEVKDGTVRN